MRRFSVALFAFVAVAVAVPAAAQSIFPFQLSVDGARYDRYLGTNRVGTITDGGIRYYVDTPDRTRLLALEYVNAENCVSPSHGLELDEESIDLGVCAPLTPVELKIAGTINRYALGDDYWAVGIYPQIPVFHTWLSLSMERDSDRTTHVGATVRYERYAWAICSGAAREQSEDHGGARDEDRFGAMLENRFEGLPFMTFLGSAVNPDAGPTWFAGFARPCLSGGPGGVNPSLFLMGRHKPEAEYLLGIATLWGRVLNDHVCSAIAESFFNGALSRSRVVRNRDFNTIGVGHGYDAVDFGRVTATFTSVNVEAGMGAHLRQSQAGLYGTLARSYGLIHNPYIGFEYQTSTDLVFNPRSHSLDDTNQEWKTVMLGCKFHVNQKPDSSPRKRPGYLRLETSFRFHRSFNGAFLTATIWQ